MGIVIAITVLTSAFRAEREPPIRHELGVMHPLGCADLAVPDTTLIRICLDSSSFRGRAGPLLHAALERGIDAAAVARLAVLATGTTYKRAENTKALEGFREAVALGQFADSIVPSPDARFFTAVAAQRAAGLLEVADDCASLRDAVRYLDITLRFPFRTDVGLDPDTMRIVRELEHDRARTRDRATRACAPHDEKGPAGGRTPPKR